MPTGGSVKLTIDADKKGWVQLPNGVYLETVASVINTTYTGATGSITYYVPKNNNVITIVASGLTGSIIYSGDRALIIDSSTLITSLTANSAVYIQSQACTTLANVSANSAEVVNATNSAYTAKSIGDILYAAYVDGRANVNFNFSGGTNANASAVYSYLTSQYGIADPEVEIYDVLVDNGGTIQLNP